MAMSVPCVRKKVNSMSWIAYLCVKNEKGTTMALMGCRDGRKAIYLMMQPPPGLV